MNTESPHLDLEDLLAEANGAALDDLARAHLASCPGCSAEVRRWAAVAAGVRHLVAATSAWPWSSDGTLDARHRNGRASEWPKPRRGVLAAAAAACALAAGGTAYGLTVAGSGTGTRAGGGAVTVAAGLAAVNGCADLRAILGTLEQVNGMTLVLRSRFGDHLVTVTTSASTTITQVETGSLSDITDGAHVLVSGTDSGRGIAAARISVGNRAGQPVPLKPGPGGLPRGTVQIPVTSGTVADASADGFTVVTAQGARIPVTTSAATSVFVPASVEVNQLRRGELTAAVGTAGANGTLAAKTVAQGVMPASGSGTKFQFPVNPKNGISGPAGLGCSGSAIATAALLAAG